MTGREDTDVAKDGTGKYISEIFSSVQGEGLLVGCRQVFIRFAGCNLHCAYCDTNIRETGSCLVEQHPGKRDFIKLPNPMQADLVAQTINAFDLPLHHSISFTGGEPLLHTPFIKELAPLLTGLTRQGLYLETNGTLPGALKEVVHMFDIIGMDIKLPSVTGLPGFWDEHKRFLEIAAQRQVYVKAVVGENTTDAEIEQTAKLIQRCDSGISLIIQPVTLNGKITGLQSHAREAANTAGSKIDKSGTISPAKALDFQSLAMNYLSNVRIIPQTHKSMDQL